MRIAFCSIDALAGAIENFDPHCIVSIWSPRWPVDDIPGRMHLHLIVDDVEVRSRKTNGKVFPAVDHFTALWRVLDTQPRRLLFQCTAGLSRSPALAIAAAVRAERDPVEVCREVARLAPNAQPNRLLLEISDDLLGTRSLPAALRTFNYSRGTGRPDGDRSPLVELWPSEPTG